MRKISSKNTAKVSAKTRLLNMLFSHPFCAVVLIIIIFACCRWLTCSYEIGDKVKVNSGININVEK